MAVPLRVDIVRQLIADRFGSVDNLVVEWEERVRQRKQKVGRARNRGTVYRWLDEGLPARKDDVLGFAALLDVDPIALLRLDDEFIAANYGRERRLFQLGSLGRSKLAAFWALYSPNGAWPDASIADAFYSRQWVVRDFTNDTNQNANTYASFTFTPRKIHFPKVPWVVHFAYRRLGSRDGMWRPYGTVIVLDQMVRLISESGETTERPLGEQKMGIPVETYFGPSGAEFRTASLHQFDLVVTSPSNEEDCVRFEA